MVNMGSTNFLLADILAETMSEDHVTVIKKLSEPKHDEDIATELDLKATIVRTLLNDLHAKDLVEYERTKNKKTGWYTYLWRRREDKLAKFVQSHINRKLSGLNEQLDAERNRATFNCSCNRVTMEEAMDTNFICPRCNETFTEFNNSKLLNELESEIQKIQGLSK